MESEQVKGPPYYLHGKSNSAGVCIFFHSFFFFFFFGLASIIYYCV